MKSTEEILIAKIKELPKHKQEMDSDVWGKIIEAIEEVQKEQLNSFLDWYKQEYKGSYDEIDYKHISHYIESITT